MQHWVEMGEQASIVIKNQLYKDNITTQGLALFTSVTLNKLDILFWRSFE